MLSESLPLLYQMSHCDEKILKGLFLLHRESIILVEAYRELVPKALRKLQVPGSYLLKREEQWIVSLNFEEGEVIWSAQSDTTGETYWGTSFTVLLYPGASLERTVDSIMNAISRTLPGNIRNSEVLKEHAEDMLWSQGYRSENLYQVELEGVGDRVKFFVIRDTEDDHTHKSGSVRVSEDMSPDDVFNRLQESIGKKIRRDEYELESPEELRESLDDVLQRMTAEQSWESLEEEPLLDPLSAALEHGRVIQEVQELRERGRSQDVLVMIDEFIEKLEPAMHGSRGIIYPLVDILLLKVEVLVSGEIAGTVDPVMLLNVLDQIEEYSYRFEPHVLRSGTRFAKNMRWALALRESLEKE